MQGGEECLGEKGEGRGAGDVGRREKWGMRKWWWGGGRNEEKYRKGGGGGERERNGDWERDGEK